ncbi:hypothetical protein D9M69_704600 [compost metagenome]
MTEVMAAAQRMTPKMRMPISPAAAWKAWAAGFAPLPETSMTTPLATTPRTARNST